MVRGSEMRGYYSLPQTLLLIPHAGGRAALEDSIVGRLGHLGLDIEEGIDSPDYGPPDLGLVRLH
jgi:hypothetical protein